MAARGGAPYRSANAGELSEEVAGRVDIKQFYSGGLAYKNVEPVPVSGFRAMAGSWDLGPVRGRVSALAQSGVTVTAGPHTDTTATIWEATVAGSVIAIDCSALAADTGTHGITAQVNTGAGWVDLAGPLDAGTTAQALALAVAPGEGVTATGVRLRAEVTGTATIDCGTVTVLTESTTQDAPRYASVLHDDGSRYLASLQVGLMDIYEDDAWVAAAYLPTVTTGLLPECNFYAENATFGIAARDLETLRVQRGGSDARWVRDLWPYDGLPLVDLGGTYTKTDDIWIVDVTWTGSALDVLLSFTVDGESTPSISYVDGSNNPVAIDDGSVDLSATAALLKAALEDLPSLGATVTVTITSKPPKHHEIEITFGGDLSGAEYQLISTIANTADAAALASHKQIGDTDFEPLFSASRGWPGTFGLWQDRLAYGDIKAVPPAVACSQAAEYFKLDISIAGASAPRLDKLRGGQVAERVLAFAEATFPLVFTNRGIYFVSNRTISSTDPLNFTKAGSTGIPANCKAVNLETKVYCIGAKPKQNSDDPDPKAGNQLFALAYSEIEQTFEPLPQQLLSAHLVDNVTRLEAQQAFGDAEASKLWMLRSDGRVTVACIIQSQEVLGFCEWVLAASGLAREMLVDSSNAVRLAVSRGGKLRHERLGRDTLFQASVTATCDLSGNVADLDFLEGRAVWVDKGGLIEGPFTVASGAISPGTAFTGELTVGLWQAPYWRSMPRTMITRDDQVIKRPGRINTVTMELIATTSVAVGANGGQVQDVPLTRADITPVDAPPAEFTGMAARAGILGSAVGTTAIITQLRPGQLHVRDVTLGERL